MHRVVPKERLAGPEPGLTGADVVSRRERFGANVIIEAPVSGWTAVARDTVRDPMLWFLLGTGVLFAVVGEHAEAVVLLAAMVPLVGMDAFLHRRTRASMAGLSSRLAVSATVIRDRREQVIPVADLVPGDLVAVMAGDSFPADGVIIGAEQLQVDESALTGEAYPVHKGAGALPRSPGADLSVDGEHWGLAGTRVLTGAARMVVVYTGGETLYGEIVRSAVRGAHERTPLQRAIADLVRMLVVGAMLLCLTLALVRWRQGHGLLDALLSALTLAVAALPEEFPVVFTFFLGVGVYRLARRQALVRRAVVVENIGRVSCICSDKTGTITEGRLRLAHRLPVPAVSEARLLMLAACASRRETGDPMDMAILDAAPSGGAALLASFPFTEDRKRETGVLREDGSVLVASKGAPEVILGLCQLDAPAQRYWTQQIEALAASGHKVIACAWRTVDAADWYGGEPDRGFQLAGLLAFEDPVRAGVPQALKRCLRAAIHVIMVTGDHPATAAAVAREIGLGPGAPRVIDGDTLMQRLEREGGGFLREVDVIARAVPSQKLGLVRALQTQGEIVAVTGDGVNDVPALQAADIGIAMGERGTRSAREVAAIVLMDDNFRSIVGAIAEGRQLFANLRLSFQYLLMIHIPLVITAAVIPLAGYPLLYLPIHIVWMEMIIHPTALLVFQDLAPGEALAARRRERQPRFFDAAQWRSILLVGAVVTGLVMVSFDRSLGAGYDVAHARAMALVALTVASAGITASLSRLRTRAARLVVFATLAVTVLLVQTPWLASLLHLRPLHIDDWLIGVGGGLAAGLIPLWQQRAAGAGFR